MVFSITMATVIKILAVVRGIETMYHKQSHSFEIADGILNQIASGHKFTQFALSFSERDILRQTLANQSDSFNDSALLRPILSQQADFQQIITVPQVFDNQDAYVGFKHSMKLTRKLLVPSPWLIRISISEYRTGDQSLSLSNVEAIHEKEILQVILSEKTMPTFTLED